MSGRGGMLHGLRRLLCVKRLNVTDGFTTRHVKLPRPEARIFAGELRNRQTTTLVLLDEQGRTWDLLCTCAGGQYAISRIGRFCEVHGATPGCFFIFYADPDSILRLAVRDVLPEAVEHIIAAARASLQASTSASTASKAAGEGERSAAASPCPALPAPAPGPQLSEVAAAAASSPDRPQGLPPAPAQQQQPEGGSGGASASSPSPPLPPALQQHKPLHDRSNLPPSPKQSQAQAHTGPACKARAGPLRAGSLALCVQEGQHAPGQGQGREAQHGDPEAPLPPCGSPPEGGSYSCGALAEAGPAQQAPGGEGAAIGADREARMDMGMDMDTPVDEGQPWPAAAPAPSSAAREASASPQPSMAASPPPQPQQHSTQASPPPAKPPGLASPRQPTQQQQQGPAALPSWPPAAMRLRVRYEARVRAQAGRKHPLSVSTGPDSPPPGAWALGGIGRPRPAAAMAHGGQRPWADHHPQHHGGAAGRGHWPGQQQQQHGGRGASRSSSTCSGGPSPRARSAGSCDSPTQLAAAPEGQAAGRRRRSSGAAGGEEGAAAASCATPVAPQLVPPCWRAQEQEQLVCDELLDHELGICSMMMMARGEGDGQGANLHGQQQQQQQLGNGARALQASPAGGARAAGSGWGGGLRRTAVADGMPAARHGPGGGGGLQALMMQLMPPLLPSMGGPSSSSSSQQGGARRAMPPELLQQLLQLTPPGAASGWDLAMAAARAQGQDDQQRCYQQQHHQQADQSSGRGGLGHNHHHQAADGTAWASAGAASPQSHFRPLLQQEEQQHGPRRGTEWDGAVRAEGGDSCTSTGPAACASACASAIAIHSPKPRPAEAPPAGQPSPKRPCVRMQLLGWEHRLLMLPPLPPPAGATCTQRLAMRILTASDLTTNAVLLPQGAASMAALSRLFPSADGLAAVQMHPQQQQDRDGAQLQHQQQQPLAPHCCVQNGSSDAPAAAAAAAAEKDDPMDVTVEGQEGERPPPSTREVAAVAGGGTMRRPVVVVSENGAQYGCMVAGSVGGAWALAGLTPYFISRQAGVGDVLDLWVDSGGTAAAMTTAGVRLHARLQRGGAAAGLLRAPEPAVCAG